MNSHKVTYLLILLVIWFQEWSIKPFGFLPQDYHLIATIAYMLWGLYVYRKNSWFFFRCFGKKEYCFIISGMLLSCIPAWLFHNQGIIQSLLTSRMQLYWLVIPLLFKIAPSEEEMISVVKKGCLLLTVFYVLKVTNLGLFVVDNEDLFERLMAGNSTYTVEGYWLYTIPVFWYLMKLHNSFFWKQLIPIGVCYILIYLMENRSTLFPITLLIAYVIFFSTKTNQKPILIFIFGLISFVVFQNTQDTWMSLYEETTSQIDDKDYTRNMEIAYYLSSTANPSYVTYILGNGRISLHGNSWVESLTEQKIFNSDVGFIGFWNYYGIIPIIVFLYTMLYAVLSKKIPYYLKLWSVQMFACGLTISYFALPIHMLYYAFFFYLLYYYKSKIQ